MSATQIKDALPGEDLIGVEPELLQEVDAGWLQRLSLFTGRTLSDTALTNEQLYRAGRLNMLGQAVTAGTVQGLDLSVDLSSPDPILTVTAGYGISATGQDVTLLRAMKTTLSGLAVLDGVSGAYLADFKNYAAPAGQPWAGVLLLQAIVTDVAGSVVDTGSSNIIVSGNLDASCDQDPSEYAFGDSQIVDGVRLAFLTWPSAPASLTLPSWAPAASWRNRLVYAIFNAELSLTADDRLPWEFLGVPLALAGFDTASKFLFVDRSAVVRTGGLSRRRYLLPDQEDAALIPVQPALANARVNQLAEQLGQILTPSSSPGLIAAQFAFLPPSGVLPPYTVDFVNKAALWCPSGWSVSATPVYAEELEGILQNGITAAPLDTTKSENIEILVPLPDAVYDPEVLTTEDVDPVFQQEINAATLARNVVLQHRNVIQLEANALAVILNQPSIDLNNGLTADEISGRDGTSVFTPDPSENFGTVISGSSYVSVDLQSLQKTAALSPYTVTVGATQIPLFNDDDWKDLQANGLQHFVDGINAKINKANDLLDLAFLTAQTDIYRYRQNVLGTADATRLAVSPILANIASGDTAAATAQNIQSYLNSIASASQAVPSTTPGPAAAAKVTGLPVAQKAPLASPVAASLRSAPISNTIAKVFSSPVAIDISKTAPLIGAYSGTATLQKVSSGVSAYSGTATLQKATTISAYPATAALQKAGVQTAGAVTLTSPPTIVDITQQSPIVGAQLRTLTIAERLAAPASQEALFYSIANRVAMLQLLADLDITIDDLQILVDSPPPWATVPPITNSGAVYTMADLRPSADPARNSALLNLLNSFYPPNAPLLPNGVPDEGAMIAAGTYVLDEHTRLLRAVEGRIAQYQDFLSLCTTVLTNMQSNMQSAQVLLTQLQNDLIQARQNLAFVQSLLADEQTRVANVNTTRAGVLQKYVQFIAYTRPRTLVDQARTPSRQLLPANVASPVPTCLKQSLAVPPELREMVALLREAPVSWFPSIQSQITKLERPNLLQDLAITVQTRATALLQTPARASSALSAPGIYSGAISDVYSAGQQTFHTYQSQRATVNPAQLLNQSWSAQVTALQSVAAVADLLSSESVHTEISTATSRSLQQISSVAACLYTRVSGAIPAERLEWAEFLQNTGLTVSLRSLAVLPGWNNQNYVDRQQMQLLVDWLFQQIDSADRTATALMSDIIAVAILLASNAPVDNIISGAVASRAKVTAGGSVTLTLSSDRLAHGMYVQLYSGGALAARAVVSDLDSTGVTATITDVYRPNVTLETNDVAHYTALDPMAIVYKAFSN